MLHAEENVNLKIYLPKRYAEGFDDQDIEDITSGKIKYNLIYKGRNGSTYAYALHMFFVME